MRCLLGLANRTLSERNRLVSNKTIGAKVFFRHIMCLNNASHNTTRHRFHLMWVEDDQLRDLGPVSGHLFNL